MSILSIDSEWRVSDCLVLTSLPSLNTCCSIVQIIVQSVFGNSTESDRHQEVFNWVYHKLF